MPSHPLINFETQKYYQNEAKFNVVYSRINLPKTKNGPYVINLHEYESIETHCIALYMNGNNIKYFDYSGGEYIPKENNIKNVITNIYRIQGHNLIMCGYFCFRCIDFMSECKSSLCKFISS